MLITDILKQDNNVDFLVVYNSSSKYFGLALNLVKKRFNVQNSDAFRLGSLSEIVKLSEVLMTKPLYSNYWLVYLEDAKSGLTDDVVKLLQKFSSVKLLIGSSNFKVFQSLRYEKRIDMYKKDVMYGSFLAREEFEFIYRATLKSKNAEPLSEKIYDSVAKGYLREPDSVFKLLASVKEGAVFRNNLDLVNHIGLGNLTVENEILSMMLSQAKTPRGIASFKKKHTQRLIELSGRKSFNSLRLSIVSSLKAMLVIKSLIAEGRVVVGVSESFDTKPYNNLSLNKYLRSIESIDGISLKKIVTVLSLVSDKERWSSELDILKFVHGFIRINIPNSLIERSINAVKSNIN